MGKRIHGSIVAGIGVAALLASALLAYPIGPSAAQDSTPAPAAPAPVGASDAQETPLPEVQAQPAAPATAPGQNVLVEGLVGEIRKLNPLLATYNPVDRDITALIFEGLTTTDDYGAIVPDLAESWTISADGLEYFVVLRDDVLWQDGLPFTADDVVYTMSVMADPAFPGAEMLRAFWRTVEVDRVGDHMVRFRLTQPLASFPDYLRIGIVPAHVLAGTPVATLEHHPFNLAPIGTGPYQLEERYATGGRVDGVGLRVAPVYRQRPEGAEGYQLDRVLFRTYPTAQAALEAYQRGEINSLGAVPYDAQDAARRLPGLSLYTGIAPELGVLIYNWESDALRFIRNPRVRLALAHAVDRHGLVEHYLAGRALFADSPILPSSWAYLPGTRWPAYDPARAQALLATADLTFEVQQEGEPLPTEAAAEGEPAPEGEATAEGGSPIPDGAPPAPDEAAAEDQAAADAEAAAPTVEPQPTADGPLPEAAPAEGAASEGETPPAAPQPDELATEAPTATPEATAEPSPEPMTFSLLTRDDPALVGMAQEIAAAWGALGFTVRVESAASDMLLARLESGDFDAALIELSFEPGADPDQFVFWHQGEYERGQNYGGMDDRRVSEALELARREPAGVNRVIHYRTFQEMFAERAPALVLYYPLYTYAADERLEGVQLGFLSSPADRFRHIGEWAFRAP